MRFFGTHTEIFPEAVGIADARRKYRGKYALILNPRYDGERMSEGAVAAVSETEDGIRRAAKHIALGNVRLRIERLFD